METPIKPGKYKCAAGQEAHILPAPPEVSGTDCLVGWVLVKETGKWAVMTWTLNGRFSHKELSQYDISKPWIDAPIFNHWDKIPGAKAVYLTQDKRWVACSHVPKYFDAGTPRGMSYWSIAEPVEYVWSVGILKDHAPVWEGMPKDSLIIRPEGV